MCVKEQFFNANKNRWEEVSRFRNCYTRQHLTSVDIEEIVRFGGVITEFFEAFICDNLDHNPFEKFVLDMTAKTQIRIIWSKHTWNKHKKEKKTYYKLKLKKYQTLFMVILYVKILKMFTNACLLIGS